MEKRGKSPDICEWHQ